MSKNIVYLVFSVLFFLFITKTAFCTQQTGSPGTNTVEQANLYENEDIEETHNSHSGMEPLLFIILALIIGAATRHFFKKTPIPYTVLLLIFGLLIGIFNRIGWLNGLLSLDIAVSWAGNIDPHVILFVFLPTLIFEAAFAMDVHTFKKSVSNSAILAVPGILIALLITGAFTMGIKSIGLGLPGWDWQIALIFGAVASATDPVAVVSLLKELGASKKLGTLIEGESLLNDGTAIVIFMVFLMSITGAVTEASPVAEFFIVSFGGIFVGLIIGFVSIAWVKKVFNDALVEISIIVAAAYLTFFIAEDFLHVSGVLGLVALGLMMASAGKTRISPQVQHFLHEFWELAAFIANTLIFIIVGVVIAQRTFFELNDFFILFLIYIGINIIRAFVITLFFPAMKRIGYGVTKKESIILWWGALRGAIALALALVIASVDDKYISPEIKNQFLFLTAGIVTLTLVINATTIKFLLKKLGLTELSPAKKLMVYNAKNYLRTNTENSIVYLKKDRFMKNADWSSLFNYLPQKAKNLDADNFKIDTVAEFRRRALENEKSSYWYQFKEGLIGGVAFKNLTSSIADILDKGGMVSLSDRQDLEKAWETPILLKKMMNAPGLKYWAKKVFFNRISISYETAHGFAEAQENALKLVKSMYNSIEQNNQEESILLSEIEEEINENKIRGLTYLRNLKKTYPEICNSISTKQAIRKMLNHEHQTVEHLHKNGRVNSDEATKMILDIEERMKRLINNPPEIKLPNPVEFLKNVDWLQNIDKDLFAKIAGSFETRLYATGEYLIKEGETADSILVISRGTVRICKDNQAIALMKQGQTVGVITVLNGLPRISSVIAETPVTAFRIKYLKIQRFLKISEALKTILWETTAYRQAIHALRHEEVYKNVPKKTFEKWVYKGKVFPAKEEMEIDLTNKIAIILSGSAKSKNIIGLVLKPVIIVKKETITLEKGSYIYINYMEDLSMNNENNSQV